MLLLAGIRYADLWRLWQCCDPWPRSRLAAVITNYNIIIMTRLNQATNPTWAGLGCGGLGWAGLRWAGHNYYFQVSWNSSRDCGAISRAGHMAPVRAQTRLDQDQTCRRGRVGDGAGMEEVCGVIIQVWAVEDRDRLRCQLVLIVRPPAAATHAEFLGKTVLARLLPAGTPRGRGLGRQHILTPSLANTHEF